MAPSDRRAATKHQLITELSGAPAWLHGRVAWADGAARQVGVGFDELPKAVAERLERYLESLQDD